MPTYYFVDEARNAGICELPKLTSEQWTQVYRAMRTLTAPDAYVQRFKLQPTQKYHEVFFNVESCNSNGYSYLILPTPENSREQIAACVDNIQRNGDVVRILTHKFSRWLTPVDFEQLLEPILLRACKPVGELPQDMLCQTR